MNTTRAPECPVFSSPKTLRGRLLLSGSDGGWLTRFYPKGLRFFTLCKSVTLSEGQLFSACLSCGHTWSRLNQRDLRANGLQTSDCFPKFGQTARRRSATVNVFAGYLLRRISVPRRSKILMIFCRCAVHRREKIYRRGYTGGRRVARNGLPGRFHKADIRFHTAVRSTLAVQRIYLGTT